MAGSVSRPPQLISGPCSGSAPGAGAAGSAAFGRADWDGGGLSSSTAGAAAFGRADWDGGGLSSSTAGAAAFGRADWDGGGLSSSTAGAAAFGRADWDGGGLSSSTAGAAAFGRADWDGGGLSSIRISSSKVFFRSLEARLNSDRLLPMDRPSSGSLRGPKMIRAMTKMIINSGIPIEPNIIAALAFRAAVGQVIPTATVAKND